VESGLRDFDACPRNQLLQQLQVAQERWSFRDRV
jgi:hypothetical protein